MDKNIDLAMAQSQLFEALFIIYVSVYIAQWLYLHARMREQRARDLQTNNAPFKYLQCYTINQNGFIF